MPGMQPRKLFAAFVHAAGENAIRKVVGRPTFVVDPAVPQVA